MIRSERAMKIRAVCVMVTLRTVWLAAILAVVVAGCSQNSGSATSVGSTSEKDIAARREKRAALMEKPSPKGLVVRTSNGKVSLKPVTPEEYKALIAAQKGKVVLVDFWATWCGPCREKFPKTLALAKKYKDQGLTVVSVSMDSPERRDQEKALHFLQEQDAQITNLSN